MKNNLGFLFFPVLLIFSTLQADEVSVTPKNDLIGLYDGTPFLHVIHNGKSIKVERVQDPEYKIQGYFSKTGRKCPPFCIKPMMPALGVKTIAEIELFKFMQTSLRDGTGMLIDARTPAWHAKGTIPGSINYPFTLLTSDPDSDEMSKVLSEFGVKPRTEPGILDKAMMYVGLKDKGLVSDKWDFNNAKDLVLWCNGASCGQSPRAIRGLTKAGYPAEKLLYYRGGMQAWQFWGLTTVSP